MNPLSKFIDIIYPPRCPICREFICDTPMEDKTKDAPFCESCFSDFKKIYPPLCPICCRPFVSQVEENHLCEECLRKKPFYEATAAPYLYEGSLMTAIHKYKYGPKSFLGDYLGPLLAHFAEKWFATSNKFLAIPVPLHPKRLRHRGFNQSLLLARHVVDRLQCELDFLSLRRVRYTLPQTGLGKVARRKNVRGAFHLKDPEIVKGKTVLLVDDVATTGNTLNECSRVLKKAGCKEIFCLVLARAGFS